MKILILSCGTGEGHNSASKALEDIFTERKIFCRTVDVLSFKSEKAPEKISALYTAVIRRFPYLFGFIYNLGAAYDCLRLPSPVYYANAKYADELHGYITENGFDRVICTHLFAMLAMTAVKKKYGGVKCYGVLTDYTVHPFMKDSDLDGYFAPDEKTAERLAKKGIKGFIKNTGIPVNPRFNANCTRELARKICGLPPNKKIIAVTTGGAGCGKIEKLCKALTRATGENCLILIFTGRNGNLKDKLTEEFGKYGVTAIGFTHEIHLYMRAADVIISKAGGLSSTEIAAVNAPLVHLKAIPGLESKNLKYFSERGLSLCAKTVKRAVAHTETLLCDGAARDKMLALQKKFINGRAAEDIADVIADGSD